MILIGLDDTDSPDSRGTNQLAKSLVVTVLGAFRPIRIVRHQLLVDDRVPYTSKNGSASLWLEETSTPDLDRLFDDVRTAMLADFIPGSDPGLCITTGPVPAAVIAFGRRCQQSLVTAAEAEDVARRSGLRLAGLGGTNGGVIGALAAVGLAATGNDGRVVQMDGRSDELSGRQSVGQLRNWGVTVIERSTNAEIRHGHVDVGKKLRPNLRGGRLLLSVERLSDDPDLQWRSLKLT